MRPLKPELQDHPPCLTPSPVRDPQGVHSPGLGGQHKQVTPSRFTGSLPDTAMWGGRAGCKQGTGEKRRKRVGSRAETCKLCSLSQDGASPVSGRAKGATPSNVLLLKAWPLDQRHQPALGLLAVPWAPSAHREPGDGHTCCGPRSSRPHHTEVVSHARGRACGFRSCSARLSWTARSSHQACLPGPAAQGAMGTEVLAPPTSEAVGGRPGVCSRPHPQEF